MAAAALMAAQPAVRREGTTALRIVRCIFSPAEPELSARARETRNPGKQGTSFMGWTGRGRLADIDMKYKATIRAGFTEPKSPLCLQLLHHRNGIAADNPVKIARQSSRIEGTKRCSVATGHNDLLHAVNQ